MSKGLAPSTLKAYNSTWSWFVLFCLSLQIPVFPILVTTVSTFIVHNYQTRNLKAASIRRMLAGIQFHARCNNPDYPSLFSNPAIRLLLKVFNKPTPQVSDKRLPITPETMQMLISALRKGLFTPFINTLLEGVFLNAFYDFMRPGEFTSNTQSFNPTRGLTLSKIRFSPHFFTIFLKHSKTDSSEAGVFIKTCRLNTCFCPYSSMTRYLKICLPTLDSPLFILPNGLPMTALWFREYLAFVISKCGLSPTHYTGHSFRIGAATTTAKLGLPINSIKLLGRWSSSAYESYMRPNTHLIMNAQLALSKCIYYLSCNYWWRLLTFKFSAVG